LHGLYESFALLCTDRRNKERKENSSSNPKVLWRPFGFSHSLGFFIKYNYRGVQGLLRRGFPQIEIKEGVNESIFS
jgi:hypothetical protein